MPRIACPSCGSFIAMGDVNVAEGVAFCRACGAVTRLRDALPRPGSEAAHTPWDASPPPGCAILDDGLTLRVVASARSPGAAVVSLAFAVFWNSLVGVFLGFVSLSLWTHLVGPPPGWLPGPLRNAGHSPLPLFLAIIAGAFLVPFLSIGVYMLFVAMLSMFGTVSVTMRGGEGTIFTGIGTLGGRRRFDALRVSSVRPMETHHDESSTRSILIEADTKLSFGSILTEPRRQWMIGALRAVLPTQGVMSGGATLPSTPDSGPPLPPT